MPQALEAQIKMFGCTQQEIDEALTNRAPYCDPLMIAMSLLSDSQELLSMGRDEEARQHINRAKYIISNEYRKEREAERKGE